MGSPSDSDTADALRAVGVKLDHDRPLVSAERSMVAAVIRAEADRLDPPAPMPHSDADLERSAKHLRYEWSMLHAVVRMLHSGDFDGEPLEENLLLESGLLHVRVLDDFFRLRRRTKSDDVIALDFTADWQPTTVVTSRVRTDINKMLAHLTTARKANRSWRMAEYFATSTELLNKLTGMLPPQQANWFIYPSLDLRP